MRSKLFTIGSSDRSAEEFIKLLKANGITLLVDVRSKNGSRVLHFDESRFHNLSRLCAEHGITYDSELHLVLGGLHNGKMTLGNFRKYTATPEFAQGLNRLKSKVDACDGQTVILCCERNPKLCHRRLIGDVLQREGWLIEHLQ